MLPIFPGLSHGSRHCIFAAVPGALLERGAEAEPRMPCRSRLMSLTPKKKSPSPIPEGGQAGCPGARRYARRRRGRPFRLRLPHHRPLPGIDRRRLCEGRFTDHRRQRSPATSPGSRRRQPAGQGRAAAWPDRRPRLPAALAQADADVAAPKPRSATSMRRLALQQPLIEQGTADVDAAEANLEIRPGRAARYDGLMKTGSGTVQRAQQTDAALRAGTAQLQHAKSGLFAAKRKIDVLATERAKAIAQVDRARAVEPGRAQSFLYAVEAAGRRHGRRTFAPGRTVCAGRHAIDGDRAAGRGLRGRQFQGDAAHPCS